MPRARSQANHAEAVTRLIPLLQAALQNPFDERAVALWFEAIVSCCPLWTLQRHAYAKSHDASQEELEVLGFRIPSLAPQSAWELMAAWSRDLEVSQTLSRGITEDGESLIYDDPETQIPRPISSAADLPDPSVAFRFLVEECRQKHFGYGADAHVWGVKADLDRFRASHVCARLRSLVTARDLSGGAERKKAQRRLDDFLRDLGASGRRGTPAVPNAKRFIRALAEECRVWLPLEHACRDTAVLESAEEELGRWGWSNDPKLGAARLVFAFLHHAELEFVRSRAIDVPEAQSGRLRERPLELTAVYLIHSRLRGLPYKLATVAEYAFYDQFVSTTPTQLLTKNPLLGALSLIT